MRWGTSESPSALGCLQRVTEESPPYTFNSGMEVLGLEFGVLAQEGPEPRPALSETGTDSVFSTSGIKICFSNARLHWGWGRDLGRVVGTDLTGFVFLFLCLGVVPSSVQDYP